MVETVQNLRKPIRELPRWWPIYFVGFSLLAVGGIFAATAGIWVNIQQDADIEAQQKANSVLTECIKSFNEELSISQPLVRQASSERDDAVDAYFEANDRDNDAWNALIARSLDEKNPPTEKERDQLVEELRLSGIALDKAGDERRRAQQHFENVKAANPYPDIADYCVLSEGETDKNDVPATTPPKSE